MAIYGIATPYTRRYKVVRTTGAVGVPVTPGTYPHINIPYNDLVNGVVDGNYIRVVMPAGGGLPQRPYWFRPPDLVLNQSPVTPPPPPPGSISHSDIGQQDIYEASGISTERMIGAGLGNAYGLWYAYSTGGGFWRYVGFFLLFGFIGGAMGAAGGYIIKGIKK